MTRQPPCLARLGCPWWVAGTGTGTGPGTGPWAGRGQRTVSDGMGACAAVRRPVSGWRGDGAAYVSPSSDTVRASEQRDKTCPFWRTPSVSSCSRTAGDGAERAPHTTHVADLASRLNPQGWQGSIKGVLFSGRSSLGLPRCPGTVEHPVLYHREHCPSTFKKPCMQPWELAGEAEATFSAPNNSHPACSAAAAAAALMVHSLSLLHVPDGRCAWQNYFHSPDGIDLQEEYSQVEPANFLACEAICSRC